MTPFLDKFLFITYLTITKNPTQFKQFLQVKENCFGNSTLEISV